MLTDESPEVRDFLEAWHENCRASWGLLYPALDYDQAQPKVAKVRTRFLALDCVSSGSRSGVFLVDRRTAEVYSIKGYGVPNRRLGTLAELTCFYYQATAEGRGVIRPGYAAADGAIARAIRAAQETTP